MVDTPRPLAEPDRIAGQADVALAPWPHAAAVRLAARLPTGARWLSSPLTRTHETAQRLAALIPGPRPVIETDGRLMEQSFGRWQGHRYADLEAEGDPSLAPFWADPTHQAPPGGESFADLCRRLAQAVGERLAPDGEHDIVCVSHAGPVRAAVALALDLTPARALALDVSPLALTRLEHIPDPHSADGGAWAVRTVNHLP